MKKYKYKKGIIVTQKSKNGKNFRRVYDRGYINKNHVIGINEIYKKPDKNEDHPYSLYYKVYDNKNSKNNKEFEFGRKKDANIYAENLKTNYENL